MILRPRLLLHSCLEVTAALATRDARGPYLVGVGAVACPNLELVAVGEVAVGKVDTEAGSVGDGKVVVGSVPPSLLLEAGVAGPDLELGAVGWVCLLALALVDWLTLSGVEAEVGAVDLNLTSSIADKLEVLSATAVALVCLDGGAVFIDRATDIGTPARVALGVELGDASAVGRWVGRAGVGVRGGGTFEESHRLGNLGVVGVNAVGDGGVRLAVGTLGKEGRGSRGGLHALVPSRGAVYTWRSSNVTVARLEAGHAPVVVDSHDKLASLKVIDVVALQGCGCRVGGRCANTNTKLVVRDEGHPFLCC